MKHIATLLICFCWVSRVEYSQAGLDEAGKFNEVIAIYEFENALDSGPRELHGELLGDASIVKRKRGKVIRIKESDAFQATSDTYLSLTPDFSIVAWVRIKEPKCCFTIGMRGTDEDDNTVGQARISILKDGTLAGWFEQAENGRNLAQNVHLFSENNVSDFRWHHIAFTRYGDIYTLFVDGEVAKRKYVDDYVSFFGDQTHIFIFGSVQDTAFIDDLLFLEIGLSVYEIKAIMKNGLDAFMQAMLVDSKDKVATTWGALKRGSHK